MSRTPFVHLRCRSAYSLLEGAMLVDQLAELCVQRQAPALALTDINLFGALEFSETLAAAGVQPIVGLTLKVRLGEPPLGATVREPDGTLALLARNAAGYARLMTLSSRSFLEVEPAEEPHLPLEAVLEDVDGLIALTGGPDGALNRFVVAGRRDDAHALLDQLAAAFGDRLCIELQRHGLADEREAEGWLVEQAYTRGLPLVATNEPYFATPDVHQAHDALLCIAQGSYLSVDNRRKVTAQHHFASGEEMAARFADLPEAIANTVEIARRCAYRPLTRAPILPRFTGEGGRDEPAELAVQAREGLAERLSKIERVAPEETYRERLDLELGVITQMGFSGYFLIVADFIKWAKSHGVPVGPGRGSGAGSLVAWALTITDLDPLRYGLLFERFLNAERVSMPDFDIDFCQERRGEVIDYVKSKYGADRVAQIITFGTLQARAVLRDVGRVMQLPFPVVDRLAKMIPATPGVQVKLADAVAAEPRFAQERAREESVGALIDTALQLEGLYRNASTHAAGVVIADRPLQQLVPLYRDPRSDLPATQFNMNWVEKAGLVKFDFLGLKTLTVLDRALAYLRKEGETLELEQIPDGDPASYALISSGASIGVFQLESSGMRDTLKKMKPDKIEDLIALISLYRPGPMKNIDTYVERKNGEARPDYLHPMLEPILKETYGVIIYQEQVMQIAQVLSGYSLGEADLLRRAMGKKKPEEMRQQKNRFIDGAAEREVSRAKASHIFDLVEEFAGYGFNKSHAAGYAVIAYQTAYLKANRPVAFLAALMSLDIHHTEKLAVLVQEARRMDVKLLPPDINASHADFALEDGAIRYALGAVRNVGMGAMAHVVEVRELGGPFKDLLDFGRRVDPRCVNKRMIENLARAGAFDSLGVDRRQACAAAEIILRAANAATAEREASQGNLFGDAEPANGARLPSVESWSPHERLDEEFAAIGFYLSGHPLEDSEDALKRRNVVFCAEFAQLAEEGRERVKVAGIVRARQERVSQKSGERFAFVALSDPTGEFEALAPPELLARSRALLEPGSAVFASARLSGREGEVRVFLEGAERLDQALAGAFGGLKVYAGDAAALKGIKARLERLKARAHGDTGQVSVVVTTSDGEEIEIALDGAWPVDAGARAALKAAPGVALVVEA
jgi:DNA polymerase-3 subunit alpha